MFDLYLRNSRKEGERKRRANIDFIVINLRNVDQPLPAEMDKFWACDGNKTRFQQFFIKWLMNTYDGSKTIYLGGSHEKGEEFDCYRVQNSSHQKIESLRCYHDEADQQIQYHISYEMHSTMIPEILVSSGDTDVFVSLMYNFVFTWKAQGLCEIWVEYNGKVSSILKSTDALSKEMILCLPAIHILTGCDVTSKIDSKKRV